MVCVSDEAAVVEAGSAESPLVAVTFQRNVHRKEKYLEAEPKALGVQCVCVCVCVCQWWKNYSDLLLK